MRKPRWMGDAAAAGISLASTRGRRKTGRSACQSHFGHRTLLPSVLGGVARGPALKIPSLGGCKEAHTCGTEPGCSVVARRAHGSVETRVL